MIPSILSRASLQVDSSTTARPASSAPAPSTTQSSRSSRSEAVRVDVSKEAASLEKQSRQVDQGKVDALRKRFAEGTYKVDPRELAQAMIAKG